MSRKASFGSMAPDQELDPPHYIEGGPVKKC